MIVNCNVTDVVTVEWVIILHFGGKGGGGTVSNLGQETSYNVIKVFRGFP
jgi:hypothetical protein